MARPEYCWGNDGPATPSILFVSYSGELRRVPRNHDTAIGMGPVDSESNEDTLWRFERGEPMVGHNSVRPAALNHHWGGSKLEMAPIKRVGLKGSQTKLWTSTAMTPPTFVTSSLRILRITLPEVYSGLSGASEHTDGSTATLLTVGVGAHRKAAAVSHWSALISIAGPPLRGCRYFNPSVN